MKIYGFHYQVLFRNKEKIDTLANNIANANTPGFKKDHISFKEHLTVLEKGLQDIDLPNRSGSLRISTKVTMRKFLRKSCWKLYRL